jgi:hypothetical protein
MASISHDKTTGTRRIWFVAPSGKRQAISLGRATQRVAENILCHVEELLNAKIAGTSIRRETATWLDSIADSLHQRLERAGLAEPIERLRVPTIADWLDTYIAGRADVKSWTAIKYDLVKRNLIDHFGPDRQLDQITPGDADGFRVWLKTTKRLSENSTRRQIGIAQHHARDACHRSIINVTNVCDAFTASRASLISIFGGSKPRPCADPVCVR